jgi:hypothetical protein
MNNNTSPNPSTKIEAAPPCLEELLHPLHQLLSQQYPTGDHEDYYLCPRGSFPGIDRNPDETLIELPDNITTNEPAMRAVATLLAKSGSEQVWVSGRFDDENPYGIPLRISLVKRSAWAGYYWKWARYLCFNFDGELDVAGARRQLGLLMECLKNTDEHVELGLEEQSLF